MQKAKIVKLAGLNLGIAAVNTAVFSPGLLGLGFSGGSFASAVAVTTLLMSLLVFGYGNYTLLLREGDSISQVKNLTSQEDYIGALQQHRGKKAFSGVIEVILQQIGQLSHKTGIIDDILLQSFDKTEMSYVKFHRTILDVEKVFYLNLRSILNRLNSFDERDYRRITAKHLQKKFSPEFLKSKMEVYQGYISYVQKATEDNEQIILKLDKILFELSKLDSIDSGDISKMTAIQEIDRLIQETKLYNQ
jgi:hypothetical protein